MADKRGDGGAKALSTVAALGAAFVARKAISVGWTKATGKEPPNDPQDPAVSTFEAIGWAIVMGAVVGAVRVLAIRAATAKTRRSNAESQAR
jgi:hypothetical protein